MAAFHYNIQYLIEQLHVQYSIIKEDLNPLIFYLTCFNNSVFIDLSKPYLKLYLIICF